MYTMHTMHTMHTMYTMHTMHTRWVSSMSEIVVNLDMQCGCVIQLLIAPRKAYLYFTHRHVSGSE